MLAGGSGADRSGTGNKVLQRVIAIRCPSNQGADRDEGRRLSIWSKSRDGTRSSVLEGLLKLFPVGMVLLVLFLADIWLQTAPPKAQTSGTGDLPLLTVIVRHADKASEPGDNPPLTVAGTQRAQDLVASLRDTKFTAIITTQYSRVRDTAQPIATLVGLNPEVLTVTDVNNSADQDAHIKALLVALHKHAAGSVLVVDHANMIPHIIAAVGGPRLPPICESAYDHLFLIVPTAAHLQLVRARYGAPSPPAGRGCM
jgi:phosphohistidine phosphatase SixA